MENRSHQEEKKDLMDRDLDFCEGEEEKERNGKLEEEDRMVDGGKVEGGYEEQKEDVDNVVEKNVEIV